MLHPKLLLRKLGGDSSFAAMFRVVMMRSLALGINVITGLVTAAVLGPAGRGEQAAMTLAPQFLAGFASLGLHASLIYKMKTDPENQWAYLGANMLLTGAASVVLSVVGWIVMPWWLAGFPASTIDTARMLIWLSPICALSWSLTAATEVQGWFSYANLVSNLQSLATLAGLLLAAALHDLTARSSAYIYCLMYLPVFAALFGRMVTRSWPVLTLRPAIAGPLLRYGLRFYGTDLLGTLSAYIDQIIILPMLSPAAVGIYVVARSLSRTLSVLSDAVASVLFPSVAGKNAKAIVSMVFQTLRVTALINFVLAASLAAMAPLLLHLVYGERFAAAATPLRILLGASLFTNSARILYQVYNGSGRPGIVTIIETVATALGTGLTIAFVPGWGTAGVATALLLASLVRLALALGAMQQVTGVALNFGGFLRGGAIEDQLL